jgi:energy-coupling factor transporter ATP-binding protein EcfA2
LALLSFKKLREEQGDLWQGGVLLIDEIDATLHPAAQNRLISLLTQEARNNQIQIVLTTHSLSFLRDICKQTAYNNHDNTVNNKIELYYLTNANRKLEIKRNPPFTEIESDLMIVSAVQNCNKTKLYSEDAEARWFLRYLVPDYLVCVEELDITIGCDQLINLYSADLQYFGNTLIVFDGDVTEKQLSKIPKPMRDSLGNILKLPGKKSPEELLYEYLLSLGPDHDFWSSGAQRVGFTWDYFNEHGPKSDDYKQEKDREKYKKWFIEHRQFFESTKLMEFWKKDNSKLVQQFRSDFRVAHNHVAKRTMALPIDEE